MQTKETFETGANCSACTNHGLRTAQLCDACGRCDECATGASTGACVDCAAIGAADDMRNAGEHPAFRDTWMGRVLTAIGPCVFEDCLAHDGEVTTKTAIPSMAELVGAR